MICPNCGEETPDVSRFCMNCGASLGKKKISVPTVESDEQKLSDSEETSVLSAQIPQNEVAASEPESEPEPEPEPESQSNALSDVQNEPGGKLRLQALQALQAGASNIQNAALGASDFFNALIILGKERFKKLRFTKKQMVYAGATAAFLLLICIIFLTTHTGKISLDIVREDFESSIYMTEGILSSDYVDATPYTVKSFSLDSQTKVDGDVLNVKGKLYQTDFSGVIANESFETEFSARSYYLIDSGDWVLQGAPEIVSSHTVPIQGVDSMDSVELADALTTPNSGYSIEISDFSSTLNEENGVFTSDASQTISYVFWFATDSATETGSFVFDEDKGWVAQESASELSDKTTTWNLAGKTLEFEPGSYGLGQYTKSTLSFEQDTESESSASYTLNYVYTGTPSNTYYSYASIHLSGTFSGELAHVFGKDAFSVIFVDDQNEVSFLCRYRAYYTETSQNDVTPYIETDITTQNIYRTYSYGYQKTEDVYELSSARFVLSSAL